MAEYPEKRTSKQNGQTSTPRSAPDARPDLGIPSSGSEESLDRHRADPANQSQKAMDTEQTQEAPQRPQEPPGALALRDMHQDASVLLQDYDTFLGLLEHPEVQGHLHGHLKDLERFMTHTERIWDKNYKDFGPLDGQMEEDGEVEDPEADQELEGEDSQDPVMEEEQVVADGVDDPEGEMVEQQDQVLTGINPEDENLLGEEDAVAADGDRPPPPTPEEALEGMRRSDAEQYGEDFDPGEMGVKDVGDEPWDYRKGDKLDHDDSPQNRRTRRIGEHQRAREEAEQRVKEREEQREQKSVGLPPIEDEPLHGIRDSDHAPQYQFTPGDQVTSRYGTGNVTQVGAQVHVRYPDRRYIIAHSHHELQPMQEVAGKTLSDNNQDTMTEEGITPQNEQGSSVLKPGYHRNDRGIYGATPRASARNTDGSRGARRTQRGSDSESNIDLPRKYKHLGEVHSFLKEISLVKAFGDLERMKSFHYHKVLDELGDDMDMEKGLTKDSFGDLGQKAHPVHVDEYGKPKPGFTNDGDYVGGNVAGDNQPGMDLAEGPEHAEGQGNTQEMGYYDEAGNFVHHPAQKSQPKLPFDPRKGDKEPDGAGGWLAGITNEELDAVEGRGTASDQTDYEDGLDDESAWGLLKSTSGFLKSLCAVKAFGDPHRAVAGEMAKALEGMVKGELDPNASDGRGRPNRAFGKVPALGEYELTAEARAAGKPITRGHQRMDHFPPLPDHVITERTPHADRERRASAHGSNSQSGAEVNPVTTTGHRLAEHKSLEDVASSQAKDIAYLTQTIHEIAVALK